MWLCSFISGADSISAHYLDSSVLVGETTSRLPSSALLLRTHISTVSLILSLTLPYTQWCQMTAISPLECEQKCCMLLSGIPIKTFHSSSTMQFPFHWMKMMTVHMGIVEQKRWQGERFLGWPDKSCFTNPNIFPKVLYEKNKLPFHQPPEV